MVELLEVRGYGGEDAPAERASGRRRRGRRRGGRGTGRS
jgi:hypothetical protein